MSRGVRTRKSTYTVDDSYADEAIELLAQIGATRTSTGFAFVSDRIRRGARALRAGCFQGHELFSVYRVPGRRFVYLSRYRWMERTEQVDTESGVVLATRLKELGRLTVPGLLQNQSPAWIRLYCWECDKPRHPSEIAHRTVISMIPQTGGVRLQTDAEGYFRHEGRRVIQS